MRDGVHGGKGPWTRDSCNPGPHPRRPEKETQGPRGRGETPGSRSEPFRSASLQRGEGGFTTRPPRALFLVYTRTVSLAPPSSSPSSRPRSKKGNIEVEDWRP